MLDAGTIVAIVGALGALLAAVATVVWKFTRVEKASDEKIASLRTDVFAAIAADRREMDAAIAAARKEADALHARTLRELGETFEAIRRKITEVELYCRDTFARRDSFYEVNRANQASMKEFFDRIEKRLERMEAKIDTNARDVAKATAAAADQS